MPDVLVYGIAAVVGAFLGFVAICLWVAAIIPYDDNGD